MESRRDKDGRLSMDAVREDSSAQYTAEWLNNVELHPKGYSDTQDVNEFLCLKFLGQPQV